MLELNVGVTARESVRIGVQLFYWRKYCFRGIWYLPHWSRAGDEPASVRTLLINSASKLMMVSSQ